MNDAILKVPFNQQQLELLDRTVAMGIAADRAALLKLALAEYAMRHAQSAAPAGPTLSKAD